MTKLEPRLIEILQGHFNERFSLAQAVREQLGGRNAQLTV